MAHSKLTGALVAGLVCAGLAGAAIAQDFTEVVTKRRAAMNASMKANGTLNAAIRAGQTSPEAIELLKGEAGKLVEAFRTMDDPTLWPKGSGAADGVSGTKAKAEIWTNEAGFKAEMEKAHAAAAQLKSAADASDVEGMKAGVSAVQGACSSCHNGFRT